MKGHALVTGGAGFIGSHVVNALIDDGYAVRVLDNLGAAIHGGRLPPWANKKAKYIKGDVRIKADWIRALRGITHVLHLAGYLDFHLDFSTFFTVNTASTALMYEAIVEKKYPIKKIIVASSQSVYGEGKYRCPKHGVMYPSPRPESQLARHEWDVWCPQGRHAMEPMAEQEDDLLKPIIPYGISKRAAEDIAMDLGSRYRLPTVAVRYTIAHGPHQTFRHFYSGALRQFAVMALSGLPMTMHEDGMQLRDYVNVRDIAAAHPLLLADPRADFRAFNIGSGTPITVKKLSHIVADAAGVAFRPDLPGLYRVGAPRHSVADISSIKKLGWRPRFTAEDSAREYVEWIRNYPEAKKYLSLTLRRMRRTGLLKRGR